MIDIEKSSHNVMDVTVYALTMQEVLQWAKEGMEDEKPRLIATANAEMIMQAQEDKGTLGGRNSRHSLSGTRDRCRPVCRAAKDRIERGLARLFLGRCARRREEGGRSFPKVPWGDPTRGLP